MAKFIINDRNCGIHLSDRHVEWLKNNGYPDADYNFCDKDRSNPALIACIEAVRENYAEAIAEAKRLEAELTVASISFTPAWAEIGELVNAIARAIYDVVKTSNQKFNNVQFRICVNGALLHDEPFDVFAESMKNKERIVSANVLALFERQYEEVRAVYNKHRSVIRNYREKQHKIQSFLQQTGLHREHNGFIPDDCYSIINYNADLFHFEVHVNWEACDSRECFELIPYVSKAKVESLVAAKDSDGLLEYLKSLNLNVVVE